MKPTLKDIAKKSGVSVPTVSMVIHGKGRISSETRETVLKYASEVGYPIHQLRNQNKTTKETNTVAVLFNIDPAWAFIWVFIRPVIQEIEQNMRDAGYTTVIVPITNEMDDEKIMAKITDIGAKAVFAMHFGNPTLFMTLEQNGIPVVLVMNNDFQDKFYSICADDFQGAFEATRYLIDQGHTRLAFIDTERLNLPRLIHDRHFGFRKALAEQEIPFSRQLSIRYYNGDENRFQAALEALLAIEHPPTAFFCLDDELAAHVIVQLEKLGKSVPHDISLMAHGDVLDYEMPYIPQITTMRVNTTLMGKAATTMMLDRIKDGDNDLLVVKVRQQIVDRGSCIPLVDALPGS
ncbi:MAG: LacI family DNA-binding transcriptional regulator [Sphaerochaeta sp.]|nr:LacI family DNA-binding transcriptional regulator [Sphaerochaeta sp.]